MEHWLRLNWINSRYTKYSNLQKTGYILYSDHHHNGFMAACTLGKYVLCLKCTGCHETAKITTGKALILTLFWAGWGMPVNLS